MNPTTDATEAFLSQLKIASPCSADWGAMEGDDRKRFCGDCNLHVYNVAGMSGTEAETLVREGEGKVCLRLHRRADGTVLTQDCPVGWAKLRQRARAGWARVATLVAVLTTGWMGCTPRRGEPGVTEGHEGHTVGSVAPATEPPEPGTAPGTATPQPLMGKPRETPMMMGEVLPPAKAPVAPDSKDR